MKVLMGMFPQNRGAAPLAGVAFIAFMAVLVLSASDTVAPQSSQFAAVCVGTAEECANYEPPVAESVEIEKYENLKEKCVPGGVYELRAEAEEGTIQMLAELQEVKDREGVNTITEDNWVRRNTATSEILESYCSYEVCPPGEEEECLTYMVHRESGDMVVEGGVLPPQSVDTALEEERVWKDMQTGTLDNLIVEAEAEVEHVNEQLDMVGQRLLDGNLNEGLTYDYLETRQEEATQELAMLQNTREQLQNIAAGTGALDDSPAFTPNVPILQPVNSVTLDDAISDIPSNVQSLPVGNLSDGRHQLEGDIYIDSDSDGVTIYTPNASGSGYLESRIPREQLGPNTTIGDLIPATEQPLTQGGGTPNPGTHWGDAPLGDGGGSTFTDNTSDETPLPGGGPGSGPSTQPSPDQNYINQLQQANQALRQQFQQLMSMMSGGGNLGQPSAQDQTQCMQCINTGHCSMQAQSACQRIAQSGGQQQQSPLDMIGEIIQNALGGGQGQQDQCPQEYTCTGNQLHHQSLQQSQCVRNFVQNCQFGCAQSGDRCAGQNEQGQQGQLAANLACAPQSAKEGSPVAVSWACQGASGSQGNGFNTNGRASGSTQIAMPGEDTTLALTCVQSGQTVTETCDIAFEETPPTGDLSAELSCAPDTVDVGSSIEIAWACDNAETIQSNGFDAEDEMMGTTTRDTVDVPGNAIRANYQVACIRSGEPPKTASCQVDLNRPTISIAANPNPVEAGTTTRIGWLSSGVESCEVSSPDIEDLSWQGKSGHITTPPITATSIVTISCATLGGEVIQNDVEIEVTGGE